MFCVLIEFHPMAGLDLHKDSAAAARAAGAVRAARDRGAAQLGRAGFDREQVKALHGRVMQRGTDIQNLIPHIPLTPAALLAGVLTGLSGSKSYFGPASVKADKKPIAAAVAVVVNYNLNCGDVPTPTGIVVAPDTVVTGMTVGDILGGVFAMLTEAAIQTAMNLLLGDLGSGRRASSGCSSGRLWVSRSTKTGRGRSGSWVVWRATCRTSPGARASAWAAITTRPTPIEPPSARTS